MTLFAEDGWRPCRVHCRQSRLVGLLSIRSRIARQFYDRRRDEVSLDEVERIVI